MAESTTHEPRGKRVDAQRNIESLIDAAKTAFATSGVDAPAREIAERAGVGLGTVYRHFPQRSDLISAVFQHEFDACVAAAPALLRDYPNDPAEALRRWLQQYTQLLVTKRGLAAALYSDAPAFDDLPTCFLDPMRPALAGLLRAATAAGQIRPDTDVDDLLNAVAGLCLGNDTAYSQRMVALLFDGLRYGAPTQD